MTDRSSANTMSARVRKLIMFPVAFGFVAAAWEGYKAVGPANGGRLRSGPRVVEALLDPVVHQQGHGEDEPEVERQL